MKNGSTNDKCVIKPLDMKNIGWWTANISQRTLYFSPYLIRLFGFETNEVSFEEFKSLYHSNDHFNEANANIRNLLLYPDDKEITLCVHTPKGYRNIYIRHTDISTDKNGDMQAEGYIKCLDPEDKPITKQHHSSTQDFLHKLYQNMPLAYYRIRIEVSEDGQVTDFEYIDANARFLEIVQLNRKDLIGKMNSEIGIIFTHDVDLQMLAEVAFRGKTFTEQVQFKTNHRFYENTIYSPQKGDIVILFADITDLLTTAETLKKNQLELQKIYDNIPIGIEVYDSKGFMISSNEKAASIQGLSNSNTLIGLNLFEHPLLPPYAHDLLKKGEDVTFDIKADRKINHAYYGVDPGDHFRYLTIKATVVYNKKDELESYLIIVIDNTEMYEANANLEKAKLKAEESDQLKSQFLSNMSHEIRTPLNAIVGFSDMLMYTEDEEEKEEYIDLIKRNNDLLLQLINDIFDLSRIESDRIEFFYSHANITKLFYSLEASSNLKLVQNKDLKVVFNAPDQDLTLFTEEKRVHQVLSNFVNNAIKFTTKGKIEIGYQVREKEVFFYVSDTGKGIPDDKQKDIFNRFIKLDEFAKGTGLGLSICQTIIQRLKGTIGVKSEEGKGSTFWFTLPFTS